MTFALCVCVYMCVWYVMCVYGVWYMHMVRVSVVYVCMCL